MRFSRRQILGGAGALVALPAFGMIRPRHAASEPVAAIKRLLVYFLPNGRVPATWVPPEVGTEFSFPPALAPLAPLKADMIALSGLYHTSAKMSSGTGDHALGTGSILTCAPYPDGSLHGDISMDQTLVKAIAPATRFPRCSGAPVSRWPATSGPRAATPRASHGRDPSPRSRPSSAR